MPGDPESLTLRVSVIGGSHNADDYAFVSPRIA
jgi:hypothetical protein